MSVAVLIVSFAVGTAALALWVNARFPRIAPGTFRGCILHVCLAMAVCQVATLLLRTATSDHATFVALFTVVVPVLVYSFLSAVWLIRVCQQMLGGAVR
ncbi:MAG: hypothetical protein ICV64_00165 [Thermoleophilia bacterium]|nr:hypothetical protein [Thermoleophilia bacterium]